MHPTAGVEEMTESQLREEIVAIMRSWVGRKESNGTHMPIIDLYNTQKPLPRGYKLKYTDAWCAATVTAAGIQTGLSDIILPECSVPRMVQLYKAKGRWMETDSYKPQPGDLIIYDWQDSGKGDNTGNPDHVGMVEKVTGKTITVIEGNKNRAVGRRTLAVNGQYIRGYCLPDYASKISKEGEDMTEKEIRRIIRNELEKIEQEKAAEPANSWAKESVDKMKAAGIMDGTRPQSYVTRQEVCIMLGRAMDK